MPISTLSFQAAVDDWTRQTEARLLAVYRESSKRVISNCQKRIPVDTGYARASIQVSLEGFAPTEAKTTREAEATYGDTTPIAVAVIAGANLQDTIFVGWTANYAIFLENGHSQQAPSGFVAISAQEWPTIVAEVIEEAKERSIT